MAFASRGAQGLGASVPGLFRLLRAWERRSLNAAAAFFQPALGHLFYVEQQLGRLVAFASRGAQGFGASVPERGGSSEDGLLKPEFPL